MNITFFRYRTRIRTKILKLKMELSDIEREQKTIRMDTGKQVDLILRKGHIKHDIELLDDLLKLPK